MKPSSDKTFLYSRNYHTTAGDQGDEDEEKGEGEVMMRTRVPSCPDLEQETQFSVVEGGGVVVEGEHLTSHLYCLDRNHLWYCTSAIAR